MTGANHKGQIEPDCSLSVPFESGVKCIIYIYISASFPKVLPMDEHLRKSKHDVRFRRPYQQQRTIKKKEDTERRRTQKEGGHKKKDTERRRTQKENKVIRNITVAVVVKANRRNHSDIYSQ